MIRIIINNSVYPVNIEYDIKDNSYCAIAELPIKGKMKQLSSFFYDSIEEAIKDIKFQYEICNRGNR